MTQYASVIIFALLTISSAVASIGSYKTTRQTIVDDLNRALTLTIAEKSHDWITPDTVSACRSLQAAVGSTMAVYTADDALCRNISIPALRRRTYLQISLTRRDGITAHLPVADSTLCSDTVVWQSEKLGTGVTLRSYANCSAAAVFGMSDQSLPLGLWIAAVLWGVTSIAYRRRNGAIAPCTTTGTQTDTTIRYGGMSMSADGSSFFDSNGNTVRLTPMQHRLMQMFFMSPTRCLARQDICDALWPNKPDASETLYTLIRRLRPVIETSGGLHIEVDRGRAYHLKDSTLE